MATLPQLLKDVRACSVCTLTPWEPRPLVAASKKSRILIIGQAPGRMAFQSRIPWNDRSGDTLRQWMGIDRDAFYDEEKIALMPMGFCFPGTGPNGDHPPRPECAPLWHDRMLAKMAGIQLRIYIGQYPLKRYFPGRFDKLTAAVEAFDDLLPGEIILPHPSPRNAIWAAKHPWFSKKVLPKLKEVVAMGLRD